MAQYSRTINKGRPQREFKRKLNEMVEDGHFDEVPKEGIKEGFGRYSCGRSTLIVKYEGHEPTAVNLFTSIDRKNKEISGLLNLIGMNY